VGHDADDQADVVDVRRLARRLPADDGARVAYEGHLAHLLPVDAVWVVRCDPAVLRGRLEGRGYPEAKVRENLEAEALDLILQEALGQHRRVVQRDGTRRTPGELYAAFADHPLDSLKGPDLEPVDWSDQLPLW
jgi:adenylate kinase